MDNLLNSLSIQTKNLLYFTCLIHMLIITVKKEGQNGIISSIAFSPDNSGMYALGSYSKSGLNLNSQIELIRSSNNN